MIVDTSLLLAALVSALLGAGLLAVLLNRARHKERAQWQAEQQRLQDERDALQAQFQQEWQQQAEQLKQTEQQLTQAQIELSGSKERLISLERIEAELFQREEELGQSRHQYATLQADYKSLQTRVEMQQQSHTEQLKLLEQAKEQLQHEFSSLANKIFENNSQRFGNQQQEKLQSLLQPVRQQLDDFKKQVGDVYDKEARDRRGLHEQIEHLKKLNQQMSEDAVNLTKALKSETKTQGNWGELVLARLLEQSGLRQGHEYQVQVNTRDAEGRRFQPDVIIYLPDDKQIILDSKVSLVDYERYCSSEDEEKRQKAMKAHVASIRRHIDGLASKGYEHLPDLNTLDCVLMFVPVDAAFMAALEEDSQLFSYGFDRNVLLVSPATLLVTLRTINLIWRNEKQNMHALEIARQAGGLYDKFVGFVEALDEVGDYMRKAVTSYETARKRLTSGRGNIVTRVSELQKLGVKGRKQLSAQLVEQAQHSEALLLAEQADSETESDADASTDTKTEPLSAADKDGLVRS